MQLYDLVRYLDGYLGHERFRDAALNGLQVEGGPKVEVIATAVDGSRSAIERAAAGGAHMLLVHHGLFWGTLEPITGILGQRVRALIQAQLSLYAAHLPLDAHREVGNNVELARLLGFTVQEPLGEFKGAKVGYITEAPAPFELDGLCAHIASALQIPGSTIRTFGGAVRPIQRLGIVSGAAAGNLQEAIAAGCDAFLTGEPQYSAFYTAVEMGVPLICAGHYHTETLGVQALGRHLAAQFGLRTFFVDLPTGI